MSNASPAVKTLDPQQTHFLVRVFDPWLSVRVAFLQRILGAIKMVRDSISLHRVVRHTYTYTYIYAGIHKSS